LIHHEGEPHSNRVRALFHEYIGQGQSTYTPTQLVVERADGSCLFSADGKRLIDFSAGVLVANLGYNHPLFEERFAHYRGQLPRNAYNMLTAVQAEASQRLVASMGQARLQKVLWAASGSEGIQKAMWACLHRYHDRPIMLATRAGFHGKKGLANDVTGESSSNPDVRWVSFPTTDIRDAAYYRAELDALWQQHQGRIALLITEPYLGAKGSFHPPLWYHQTLQHWCNEHDIPFIFDEVQSCFGRTGEMYAFQKYEVQPDLVVLGKGLANGEPASAAVGRADLIDSLKYGEASDTFSGTPAACAAVCAALDVYEQTDVLDHARRMGLHIQNRLRALQERFSFIQAVRGEGLVSGVEMSDPDTANACVLEAYRGAGDSGVHFLGPLAQKVLRVSPPLVISQAEVDEAFTILGQAWARI
jgi:4-aminobutyrate aminotransferase-like enzyme